MRLEKQAIFANPSQDHLICYDIFSEPLLFRVTLIHTIKVEKNGNLVMINADA